MENEKWKMENGGAGSPRAAAPTELEENQPCLVGAAARILRPPGAEASRYGIREEEDEASSDVA
jgi:hypothetical protein